MAFFQSNGKTIYVRGRCRFGDAVLRKISGAILRQDYETARLIVERNRGNTEDLRAVYAAVQASVFADADFPQENGDAQS